MLNRQSQEILSERQLQKWAEGVFKEHRHVFLICSSTNFDSLASFYHAAKSNGMNMYGNRYVVRQLRTITEYTKKYGDLYQGWRGKQKDLIGAWKKFQKMI